jgi:hypothetical protein
LVKNRSGGAGLSRKERLQFLLSADELAAIDSFRFAHWMPPRAAAVREPLRYGIASTKGRAPDNAVLKSGEYGVLKSPKGVGS